MDLPDARGLSRESLELVRRLAVRAVFDLGMTQKDAARFVGVHENSVSGWCAAYREQEENAFKIQPQGRPEGIGRSLSPEQEQQVQQAIRESVPEDHGIPASTWTRSTIADLIDTLCGIKRSDQGVGNSLKRWNMTPPKPAQHAREQDPEEVREFVEKKLPAAVEKAACRSGKGG